MRGWGRWTWVVVLIVFGGLTGCGTNESVHIRIENATNQDMAHFWLGAGGTSGAIASYGAISRGATSRYKAFAPKLANYGKSNFTLADGNNYGHVTYAEPLVGTQELAAGYYTFVYRLDHGQVHLAVNHDQP